MKRDLIEALWNSGGPLQALGYCQPTAGILRCGEVQSGAGPRSVW
jgi:hypothetical protein